ncbi:MAG: hypothetical protein KIS96_00610 [Bauldia sp.]|nr:hypothetical protein [Bauldia sp.]
MSQVPNLSLEIRTDYLQSPSTVSFDVVETIPAEAARKLAYLHRNKGFSRRWTNAAGYIIGDIELDLRPHAELRDLLKEQRFSHSTERVCRTVASRRIFNEINHQISDIVISSNIAELGTIAIDSGGILSEVLNQEIDSVRSLSDSAYEELEKSGWPRIGHAPLLEVHHWYSGLNGTTAGHSSNPIERAACAFSHLFHKSPDAGPMADLVWSLIGVEALLGEAGESRRLTDKAVLLFPPNKSAGLSEINKRLRACYDFRSRMIHGNINIRARRIRWDGDDPLKLHYLRSELEETDFAVGFLSQLLLYCYKHSLKEVRTKLAWA